MTAATFPAELRALPQWVLWRLEIRDGKRTKVPYQTNGRRASSTDPTTWSEFETIVRAFDGDDRWSGISFCFSPNDPYCGIDLDHVIDPRTGEVDGTAAAIIDRLGSYTEYSPSGTGTHTYVRATLPSDARHKLGAVECYDRDRIFTVTGRAYGDTSETIAAWDGEDLQQLLYPNAARPVTLTPIRMAVTTAEPLSDREVYDLAARSANSAKFRDLWNGGFGGHSSQSEADSALCWMLAFWTGRNSAQIDSLFRQSGLFRPKWDERRGAQTYGQLTIRRACEHSGESYARRSA